MKASADTTNTEEARKLTNNTEKPKCDSSHGTINVHSKSKETKQENKMLGKAKQ